jgi:hypothetical protein
MLFDLFEKLRHLIRLAKDRRFTTHQGECAGNIPQCYIFRISFGADQDGHNGGDRCMRGKHNAERGRMSPGSSKRIIKNAGAAINMLNSVSMQNDSGEGAFLFIQLGLEAIILFPWHKGIK